MANNIEQMYTPLSATEIRDLLGATLHGPLPVETMSRVFSTLAKHAALLKVAQAAIEVHSWNKHSDDACPMCKLGDALAELDDTRRKQ